MRSSFPVVHGLAAVAGLLGVANAQAFFEAPAGFPSCEAFPIRSLGCFQISESNLANLVPFRPGTYTPASTPDPNSSPNFDPGTVFDNTVTPADCTATCRSFGFKYTILFDGDCLCSTQVAATGLGIRQQDGFCDTPCGGDVNQGCGGTGYANFYLDTSFGPAPDPTLANQYKYLGCYRTTGFANGNDDRLGSILDLGIEINNPGAIASCHNRCAGYGYPLVAALGRGDPNFDILCQCGTAFNAGSYRLRGPEFTANAGDCNVNCDDGSIGCNPEQPGTRCCGKNGFFPVYINPELQGCYTPTIPGIKDAPLDPSFECFDVPASFLGAAKTLPLAGNLSGSTILESSPALIRPPFVESSSGAAFYLYGCVRPTGSIIGGLLAALSERVLTAPASFEACATACVTTYGNLVPYMAVGPLGCVCGTGLLASLLPEGPDPLNAEECNVPCTSPGSGGLSCGGDTEYLLYVRDTPDAPAYSSYSSVYLNTASPTPSYVCERLATPTTTVTTSTTTSVSVTTATIITEVEVTVSGSTVLSETTYTTEIPVTETQTETQLVGTFTEIRTVLETETVTTPYLATITWTTQGSTVTEVSTFETTYTTVSTRVVRGPPRTITETFTRDGVVRTTTVTRDPPAISDPPAGPSDDCSGPRCTLSLRFGLMRLPEGEPGAECSIVTGSWLDGATELLPSATLPAIGEASDAPAAIAPEGDEPEEGGEDEPLVGQPIDEEPEEDGPDTPLPIPVVEGLGDLIEDESGEVPGDEGGDETDLEIGGELDEGDLETLPEDLKM